MAAKSGDPRLQSEQQANVIVFDKESAAEQPWTERLWIYDPHMTVVLHGLDQVEALLMALGSARENPHYGQMARRRRG